jgi:Tol biopolymer transport system component
MTADQLKICFTSDRAGGSGGMDIWCATRASTSDLFGTPVNLSAINSSGYDAAPGLNSDGSEIFFSSQRGGQAGNLYRAVWVPADNTYEFSELATSLNSSGDDTDLALTGDDLVALFESDRSGPNGSGTPYDLYMAVRPDRSSALGTPTKLTSVSSPYFDGSPSPSPDGYSVVFSSERPTSSESGVQRRRLWGVQYLGNNQWGTPELVQFDGFNNSGVSGAAILSDGSLLFQSDDNGGGDLYIAPPK